MQYPLILSDHPLAAHKLTLLRDARCDSPKARELFYELGLLLAFEATRSLELSVWSGQTYEGAVERGSVLEQLNMVALPVIRSGLVLAEAFAAVLPSARTGHLGIHHDYTDGKPAISYMISVPNSPDLTDFFIIDSIIGTGETMKLATKELRSLGVKSSQMRILAISVHDQGLSKFYAEKKNHEIPIYALEHRDDVDAHGLPAFGFGNTADRIYGTEKPND